jgi:hypothetical protein
MRFSKASDQPLVAPNPVDQYLQLPPSSDPLELETAAVETIDPVRLLEGNFAIVKRIR